MLSCVVAAVGLLGGSLASLGLGVWRLTQGDTCGSATLVLVSLALSALYRYALKPGAEQLFPDLRSGVGS